MKKILSAIGLGMVAVGLLVGCDNPEYISARNERSFRNPVRVGAVNGKTLFCVEIKIPNNHSHFVYFFKGVEEESVSINHTVRSGKVSKNSVQVLLNGNEVSSFVVTNH